MRRNVIGPYLMVAMVLCCLFAVSETGSEEHPPTSQSTATDTAHPRLMAMLEERRLANMALKAEWLEGIEDPGERAMQERVGQQLVDFCVVIQQHPNNQVIASFLRLEYLYEIQDCHWQIQEAPDGDERKEVIQRMRDYHALLAELDQIVASLPRPSKASDTSATSESPAP